MCVCVSHCICIKYSSMRNYTSGRFCSIIIVSHNGFIRSIKVASKMMKIFIIN